MVIATEKELLIAPPFVRRGDSARAAKCSSGVSNMGRKSRAHTKHSSVFYSCGDDFWSSCWENDPKEYILQDYPENSSSDFGPLTTGGVYLSEGDSSDDEVSFENAKCQLPPRLSPQKIGKANRRVHFSTKVQSKEAAPPLTEEERAHYFWTDDDGRQFKEERRALVADYKNHFSYGVSFWADNDEDSMRGLEDHATDVTGETSSYHIRREHERRVLLEFFDQKSRGSIEPELLRGASQHSSMKSTLRALERGRSDFAATKETKGSLWHVRSGCSEIDVRSGCSEI